MTNQVRSVPTDEIVDGLLQFALYTGGQTYNDRKFQRLMKFTELDEIEQGRLFNELLVTAIGGLLLSFDDELFSADAAPFLKQLRSAIKPGFKRALSTMGLSESQVRDWLKLYDLRMKEYRRELDEFVPMVKLQLAEIAADEPLRPKQLVARMLILSTAALSHLRRGQLDTGDPLQPYLKNWLIRYLAQLSKLAQPLLADS